MPSNLSLDPYAHDPFFRYLRDKRGIKCRYVWVGEYGDRFKRPHYHALIFGWRPSQDESTLVRRGEFPLYTHPILDAAWGHKGFVNYGAISFQSAAYTARYSTKKVTGKKAESHYNGRYPEFLRSSTGRGGIGAAWIDQWMDEVYPRDKLLVNNKLIQPPRFYDKRLAKRDPELLEAIKLSRVLTANARSVSFDADLEARERAVMSRFNLFMRSFE